MQSPIFVFAGFKNEKFIDQISILLEELNKIFLEQQLPVSFDRKEKLLTAEFEYVNFFVSIFDDEKEVKDWYQMAKDFELTASPNPIDDNNFKKRLTEKKLKRPGLYNDVHYVIGTTIYEKMNELGLAEIYFFF